MSDDSTLMTMDEPCNQAVERIIESLKHVGLSVIRTFNLQAARNTPVDCPCPEHGSEQCECQVTVLLVYGSSAGPLTVVAHGCDRQTWFSVVNTPQQRADPQLEAALRQCCLPYAERSGENVESQTSNVEL